MELAPANQELSFEVTFTGPGLFVAMSVYDNTDSSPVLVQGPTAMTNVVGGTYEGKFVATAGRSYVIFKAVYTDDTYTELNPNFGQGSESIFAQIIPSSTGGGSTGCAIIGFVDGYQDIIGFVNC